MTQPSNETSSAPTFELFNLAGKFIFNNNNTLNPESLSNSNTYTTSFVNVSAGYKYLAPGWSGTNGDLNATITYTTDPYVCPFASTYIDYYGTFSGCSSAASSHQAYTIQAHQCGIRQFFNGTCNNVDPSCNTFDPLTGNCFTCLDPTQTVVQGACVTAAAAVTPPTCAPGQTLFNNAICIPETCSAADATGACTACVNTAFVLNNGACNPVNCGTGLYFSVALGQCTFLPAQCVSFNALTQLCASCTAGFFPDQSGGCASPCPTGQFFVNNQCFTLPANCQSLNTILQCDDCGNNFRLTQG